jgi:CRP/FNR family transcriptional regulator, cyclic AMP receptor protein
MDAARLTRIPVFSELSPDELSRLAAFATETSYPQGAKLLREGDYSTELFAIVEGTAEVVRGGEPVGAVGPGDLIGEMGLLEKKQRNADVIATSPMLVISVSHWEIRRMSKETIAKIEALVTARRQDR